MLIPYLQRLLDIWYQIFIVFPLSAITIPRQPHLPSISKTSQSHTMPMPETDEPSAVSDRILELCCSDQSVSTLLAESPKMLPGEAWKTLYGHHITKKSTPGTVNRKEIDSVPQEGLARAAKAGKWGPTQPSDLFLQVRQLHISTQYIIY
jgi:hypothetical protein